MRKVMLFTEDLVFNFLKKNNYVFSFRTDDPDQQIQPVWVATERPIEEKKFNATRIVVKRGVNPTIPALKPFFHGSGFGGVVNWQEAIKRQHGVEPYEDVGNISLVVKEW